MIVMNEFGQLIDSETGRLIGSPAAISPEQKPEQQQQEKPAEEKNEEQLELAHRIV